MKIHKWLPLISFIFATMLDNCADLKKGHELPDEIIDDFGHEMILIPANCFHMGEDSWYMGTSLVIHKVCLSDYYMDKFEVTNLLYREFLAVSGKTAEDVHLWIDLSTEYTRIYWEYGDWKIIPGYENHPVLDIEWYGAQAYCEWRGARLPTEAEWEMASRGTDEFLYPWGDDKPTCELANYYRSCIGGTAVVGSYPEGVSVYGIHDLAGNADEWVSDWFGEYYYYWSPKTDPQGPSSGDTRVLRGCSWIIFGENADLLTLSSNRIGFEPTNALGYHGFRCARTP